MIINQIKHINQINNQKSIFHISIQADLKHSLNLNKNNKYRIKIFKNFKQFLNQ